MIEETLGAATTYQQQQAQSARAATSGLGSSLGSFGWQTTAPAIVSGHLAQQAIRQRQMAEENRLDREILMAKEQRLNRAVSHLTDSIDQEIIDSYKTEISPENPTPVTPASAAAQSVIVTYTGGVENVDISDAERVSKTTLYVTKYGKTLKDEVRSRFKKLCTTTTNRNNSVITVVDKVKLARDMAITPEQANAMTMQELRVSTRPKFEWTMDDIAKHG